MDILHFLEITESKACFLLHLFIYIKIKIGLEYWHFVDVNYEDE